MERKIIASQMGATDRYKEQNLPINKSDTIRFIELISGDRKALNHFTALKKNSNGKTQSVVLFGEVEQYYSQLVKLNHQGFNIFMAINECGKTRTKKTIKKIRAVFYDNDSDKLISPKLVPSFRVISGRGDHGYWLMSDVLPVNEFERVQYSIAHTLNTDPAIIDASRLMRVPGFAHMKDPSNPKPVRLVDLTDRKYSAREIKSVFPIEQVSPKNSVEVISMLSQAEARRKLTGLIKKAPIEEGSANPKGGRNQTALPIVREGLALGLPTAIIFSEMIKYCQASGLPETELEEMIQRQVAEHAKNPFESFLARNESKKLPTSVLTEMFLDNEKIERNYIRYWRGEFYLYNGSKYIHFKLNELKPRIVGFFSNTLNLKEKYRTSWVEDVVTHLTGIGFLPSSICSGADILEPNVQKHLVFLKNCILHLDSKNKWKVNRIEHDPRYFSQVALPYEYNPKAKCPIFIRVLGEILPDKDAREFLQEWFGYNLIHDTSFAKFLVLLGDGANGKSVLLTILTALIGRENISAVPLENFSATRTFPLAVTIGKLSNIVDEMGTLKGVEATLKQFVNGSIMNVERKGKDGMEQKPTARLTFATNSMPTFHDRTDGLWRRMIVIPMTAKFMNESKRDANLSRLEWWEQSEELAGVLNWSLEGLQRVMARGHFAEPRCAVDFKNDFRQESDHVALFIEERLTDNSKAQVGATTLYSEYARYSNANGILPLTPATFAEAIRKAFPKAKKSPHPLTIKGKGRERVWWGIEFNSQFGEI